MHCYMQAGRLVAPVGGKFNDHNTCCTDKHGQKHIPQLGAKEQKSQKSQNKDKAQQANHHVFNHEKLLGCNRLYKHS